jgi:hypothetical protein
LFGRVAVEHANAQARVNTLVREVAAEVGMNPELVRLGLEYEVGNGGSRLAYSQRQRLAIARGLIKNPDVLVFNEPTSGLDPASEARVLKAVLEWAKGRTVVWALGRADLARAFDRVLVLDDGRVIEQGSFEELDREGHRPQANACVRRPSDRERAMPLPLARVAAFVLTTASALVHGAVYEASPADYRQSLKLLRPGDTLRLAAGEYRDGLALKEMSGALGQPIVITGPEQGEPATFVARPGHNTVSIVDSSHLEIRNLALEGHNLPVDAVKAEGHSAFAHHITLENLTIRGHGNNQQTVGISTKCPAWNWVIRGVTIVGAGTGMYLGDSNGKAPFVAGLIERNLVVDSTGYNLQIKHQVARPDLPDMPAGRNVTIIRHNVFAKANSRAPEAARPSMLVGHFPREGLGAEDHYLIYGNFFYQNRNEALFQGEGNVALYANVFVNDFADGVHIQPHNDVPRRIVIAYNTVVAKGAGIVVTVQEGGPRYQREVRANAVFAQVPIAAAGAVRNLAAPLGDAPLYLKSPFAPAPGSTCIPRRAWTTRSVGAGADPQVVA